jgi:NitT/TauT family transport system ATP-binding protein
MVYFAFLQGGLRLGTSMGTPDNKVIRNWDVRSEVGEGFLQVSDLTVTFGGGQELVALSETTFEVHRGEFVCVLGPSGCGKSTLLNVIAGFVTPNCGSVRLGGKTITQPSVERGMVFQEHTLFPWKTVWGNIALAPRMKGLSKEQVRHTVNRLVALVGLNGFEKAYPYELSGGMAQRVGLARLLAADPEVLLMDEPFGSLDSQTRLDMQEELLRIWEDFRKTVLFITHDIDEALLLSDRVLLMSRRPGRILETFNVPLPRPRTASLTNSPDILRIRAEIFGLIRKEQHKSVNDSIVNM